MKKILLIDHSYHSVTGSSAFFCDILRNEYELTIFCVDLKPGAEVKGLASLSLNSYDCILLWQVDFLASYFLRRGMPTIVCPMYDASSTLNAAHWRAMSGALIICFSLELHFRVQAAGVDSLYVRYFPEGTDSALDKPAHNGSDTQSLMSKNFARDCGLRVFFWERLPDTSLCVQSVINMLKGLPVSHLHVHQAPDPGRTPHPLPASHDFSITVSSWFEIKSDYCQAIKDCDIYIAPRFSEGIGMSFLEAMSYGCCVIAHDMATHNEYISNWSNGILVDFNAASPVIISSDASTIRSLGRRAREDAKKWRQSWVGFYSDIASKAISNYIASANPEPTLCAVLPPKMLAVQASAELNGLLAAHRDWSRYWAHLASLASESRVNNQRDNLFIPQIHELVRQGNLLAAHSALSKMLVQNQDEDTVYQLFADQLLMRIELLTHLH